MSDDDYYMRILEDVEADMQCVCILINLHLRENLSLAEGIVKGCDAAELNIKQKNVEEREKDIRFRAYRGRGHMEQLQNKVGATEMQKIHDLEAKMTDRMQWHDGFMNMIQGWHTNNPNNSEGLEILKTQLERQIDAWKQESPSLYITEEDSLNELRKDASGLYPEMKAHLRASVHYCLGCADEATDLSARLETMKRAEKALFYRMHLIAMHKGTTQEIMTNPELRNTFKKISDLIRRLFDWYGLYAKCFESWEYHKPYDRQGMVDLGNKMETEITRWDEHILGQQVVTRDYNTVLSDVQGDARQIRLLVQSHLRAHMSVAEEYAERGDEETINERKTFLREQSQAVYEQKKKAERDIAEARRAQTDESQKHEIDRLQAIISEQLRMDKNFAIQIIQWYKYDKSREGLVRLKEEMEREITGWDKQGF